MAKLTLADGTIFEGTTEEIFAITERFNEVKSGEPIAESLTHNGVDYTKVDRKAQEGDVVIIPKGGKSPFFNEGDAYVVSGIMMGGDVTAYGNDGDFYALYVDDFNRTEANVLVYAPKVEALKVGDYAVVEGYSAEHNGTVVELTSKWTMEKDKFDVMPIVDSSVRSMGVKYLRKATDEEVAEAKAKAEASAEQARKEAVFTQAGRKPNEYRKGDIVRVTKPSTYNDRPVGSVFEVISVDKDGDIYDEDGMVYGLLRGRFEIVTFAESRLDHN